jgi:hypothetical protein
MATNNFNITNMCFAVQIEYYTDEETGEEIQSEFTYEDMLDTLKYELENQANNLWHWRSDMPYTSYGYNSGHTIIAQTNELYVPITGTWSGDSEAELQVYLVTKSGYYDGFSFDYIIDYDGEEFTQKEWDNAVANPVYFLACNKTEAKKADAYVKRSIKQLFKVLPSISEQIIKVAQFSDGTAMYQKI